MTNISFSQKEKLEKLFQKSDFLAVYLFGSRVDGTANEKSDYDFGILLESPFQMDEVSLLQLAFEEEASVILKSKVDSIILNTATIEQKFMIISRGDLLYSNNDDKRTDFEDITIRDYLDFKPFYELYRQEVRESIKEGDFFA